MTIHRYATSLFLSFTYSNNVILDLCHFVMAQCRCCGEPSTTLNLLHLRTPFRLHKCPAGTSSSHGGLSHLPPSYCMVPKYHLDVLSLTIDRLTSPAFVHTGGMTRKARAAWGSGKGHGFATRVSDSGASIPAPSESDFENHKGKERT